MLEHHIQQYIFSHDYKFVVRLISQKYHRRSSYTRFHKNTLTRPYVKRSFFFNFFVQNSFFPRNMTGKVVFYADRFINGGRKQLKQLAFYSPSLGISKEVDFFLPPGSAKHQSSLTQQAYHSHGMLWTKSKNFEFSEIPPAFRDIFTKLLKRPADLASYTKGLDKCQFSEKFVLEVQNLEDFGCPSFKELATCSQTALRKALVSESWLE